MSSSPLCLMIKKRTCALFWGRRPTGSSIPATGTPTGSSINVSFLCTTRSTRSTRKGAGRAELDVGTNDWPLPIPLVEREGRWTFDTKAGAQTIIDRRIGRNELSAIRTLLASVDAQRHYFDRVKQANGTGAYATRFVSTPGHYDGLYWPVGEGESESPLGPLIDAAREAGYPGELVGDKPIPYEGYYFRILSRQGPNGDGGTKSYLNSGRMTGGFALIAWPAVYESTGIMTFIAGPEGDVYQKDL